MGGFHSPLQTDAMLQPHLPQSNRQILRQRHDHAPRQSAVFKVGPEFGQGQVKAWIVRVGGPDGTVQI